MYPFLLLLLLLFADASTAGTVPPLFVAVPDHATAVDGGLSRGVAFGDADGDGDADLLIANTINYPEFLYRNDGDRFVQVMETAPSLAGGFTEGVNWIDFDNDGDLDIFAARTDRPNTLYRNDGNWSFAEQEAGDLSMDHSTSSMACWADVDGDGWLDVFVVNRGGENDAIYRNHNGHSFERITDNVVGRAGGDGRSCVFADLDGDDDPDLYVGNFVDASTEPPTKQRNYLYINDGNFRFTEHGGGHAVESRALTYGTSAADADGDGDLDLDGDIDVAIANGTEGTEHVQNQLYLNDGAANFVAVTGEEFVTNAHISAGIAWADIDMDGDLDLYVANWGDGDQDNVMYQNQARGTWLKLSLVGSASNRMAVGARVTITTRLAGQSSQQVRWLSATTGYASQNEPVLHFGLAGATNVETLRIDWPSGRHNTFENITANQHLRINEGET